MPTGTIGERLLHWVKEFNEYKSNPENKQDDVYIIASKSADEELRKELFTDSDIDANIHKLYGMRYMVSPFLDAWFFISYFNYSGVVGERNMRTEWKMFKVNDIFNYITVI